MTIDADALAGLAEEYSAAVRVAGYSDPLHHPELITDADFDAVEEANPGLTYQPEHRLLGTVFGITKLPGGDQVLRSEMSLQANEVLWRHVDELGLYDGLDISWWPQRGGVCGGVRLDDVLVSGRRVLDVPGQRRSSVWW